MTRYMYKRLADDSIHVKTVWIRVWWFHRCTSQTVSRWFATHVCTIGYKTID